MFSANSPLGIPLLVPKYYSMSVKLLSLVFFLLMQLKKIGTNIKVPEDTISNHLFAKVFVDAKPVHPLTWGLFFMLE